MKGFFRVIIAGVVILILGIGIIVIALGINGWKIDGDYEMKSFECVDVNSTLDIDFSVGCLEINYYEGEKIKIEYPENKNLSASIAESNGKLSFETTNKRKWLNFDWLKKIPTTKIWIPQGEIMDMVLVINAGTVKVPDGEYGNFTVDMSAGNFSMGDVKCKKFSVEVSAGNLSAKNVSSTENVRVDLSAGNINIQSLVCPSVVGDVSAGNANIGKLQSSSVDFDISAGNVKLGMVGAKSDYNVIVEKSAGSCNISNQTGAKNLRIKADISAGNLNVKFES